MGKTYAELTDVLTEFIGKQHLFFVATAPVEPEGHVNVSPKGLDSFRVLSPTRVAYLDLIGSGVETVAHVRQNRRITLMFCALEGPPKIVRIYGVATVILPDEPAWSELAAKFVANRGARSIVMIDIDRIADSCGYSIPRFAYKGERDTMDLWVERKSDDELVEYQRQKNAVSIDGMPGLPRVPPRK